MSQTLQRIPSTPDTDERRPVPDAVLARVQRLYDQGFYLQAHVEASAFGDPRLWTGMRALVWASRLANNLGAPRLAHARALQAFRQERGDAEALFYAAGAVLTGKGPLAALHFLEAHAPRIAASSTERRADLVALRARILAIFRDFDRADRLIDEAERLCPESPWILVERSFILRAADRYEDSLAAAQRATALSPHYRPAIQALAQAQALLGQGDEAYALLAGAAPLQESGALWLQLNDFHVERERFAEAGHGYAEYVRLSPMMEPGVAAWIAGARARVAYLAGERGQAAAFAAAAGGHYFTKMAHNIAAAPAAARRVELPVPFLRQRHMTCAPTCLAMLGHVFGKPVDQEAIAAEICYDGTEDHMERHWAEQNGYLVKEFSVDWATTVALIDRGVPFCLNTQETSSAHLQIVMGYDAVLGLLLIRDPYNKATSEFLAEEFFERYAHNGPRGMAIVPQERAALVLGVPFVDVPFHEARHAMRRALLVHDRAKAQEALEAARALGAGHWIPLSMQLDLARYDSDAKAVLDLTARLYELNPANKRYLHYRLNTLRDHARQDVRLALLEDLVKKPGCDPVFYVQLADELRCNRQRLDEAELLLGRAIALRPADGANYWYLAEIRRQGRQWAQAAELMRLAACMDDKNEFLATAYFSAARVVEGGIDAALAFLRARFERFGHQSAGPARSLHWALVTAERTAESFATLTEALARRPADGELLLYAADAYARQGYDARADELMQRAEGKVQPVAYFEALAVKAQLRGERRAALDYWHKVAALNPHSASAHNHVAGLLDTMRSRRQAVAYMQELVARHPDNRYLRKALVEWLRDHDSLELGQALRGLIEVWPHDAWAHRELALYCAGEARFADADAALAAARALEPDSHEFHYAQGYVERLRGNVPGAQAAFLLALERHVDSGHALAQALRAAAEPGEKAAIIRRFKDMLLATRTTLGQGLLHFHDQGADHLDDGEMLAALTELHAAFDHLPEGWSTLARQYLRCGEAGAALKAATEAAARFPLHQATWITLAEVNGVLGDEAALEQALLKSIDAQPASGAGVRRLAEFHEKNGDFAKEQQVLEAALARNPLDAGNLGYLADCLWRRGAHRPAIERLKDSLKINQRVDWGWTALGEWAAEVGEPELAGGFARDLAQRRQDDAWAWTCLARALRGDQSLEERLAALDRAIALDDELFDAYELKIDLLLDAGRTGDALAFIRATDLPHDKQQRIRAKEARVLLEGGDAAGAAAVVSEILAREPLSSDGLTLFADVAQAREDWDGYLAAAEALVRFHPRLATSHGYLGDARLKKADEAGAKAAFKAALAVAPDYEFAAFYLFDLQLEAGEPEDARATLALLTRTGQRTPPVVQREALLAVATRQEPLLGAALGELCGFPEPELYRLEKVAEAAVKSGFVAPILALLAPLAAAPGTAGMALKPYMKLCAEAGDWAGAAALVGGLQPGGAPWVDAAAAYAQVLVDGKQRVLFRKLVLTQGPELKKHDRTWALIGHGFGAFRLDGEGLAWLADWRSRTKAEGWILYNMSVALRRAGRDEEAGAANLAGAALGGDEHAALAHALWGAFHAATCGDEAAARALLGRCPATGAGLDDHDRMVHEFATASLAFFDGGRGRRGYLGAVKALRGLRAWKQGPFCLGFYDRELRAGVRRLGRTAGFPWNLHARLEGQTYVVLAVLWLMLIAVRHLALLF